MYRLRFSVIKVADGCEHKIFCADGFPNIVLLIGRRVLSLSLTFLIFYSLSTLSKRREPLHPFKSFTNSSTFWGITAFLDATATYCSVSCIHFTFASLPPADGRNGFHQCAHLVHFRRAQDVNMTGDLLTKTTGGTVVCLRGRGEHVLLLPCADSSQLDLNLRCPLAQTDGWKLWDFMMEVLVAPLFCSGSGVMR